MSEERKTDNFHMRMWLETIQNIIGSNGLNAILNHANLQKYRDDFPPDNDEMEIPLEDVKNLRLSLIDLFGSKGAWGLQLRVGREITRIFVKRRSGMTKAIQLAGRLLPEKKRIQLVLEKYMEQAQKMTPSSLEAARFEFREEEDYFLLIDKDRYESEGMESPTPVCGILVGTFQGMIEWITGHRHKVEEIECRAMGHSADVFRVWKSRETEEG
jgi:predicted hydrocarbon binding protein